MQCRPGRGALGNALDWRIGGLGDLVIEPPQSRIGAAHPSERIIPLAMHRAESVKVFPKESIRAILVLGNLRLGTSPSGMISRARMCSEQGLSARFRLLHCFEPGYDPLDGSSC